MDHGPYYKAAIPDPCRLLGLKLRPLSLGHLLLLRRVGSAFVTGGRPGYDDLALSVFICSQTYEEGCAALDDPELPAFMARWQRRLCNQFGLLYVIGLRKEQPIDLPAKALEFTEYMKAGSEHPDFTWNEDGGKAIDAPIEQIVKVKLMSCTALTESEILNRPWSLSLWDYITLKVLDGQVEFSDAEEIEHAQAMAAKLAEKLRGING